MISDSPIDHLRERLEADPTSVAFAALAEHYRRAGRFEDAAVTARAGLEHHPSYVSARVTLGRALIELDELEAARVELEQVLTVAPENLLALKALAGLHRRRGELYDALVWYRRALDLARQDNELKQVVEDVEREATPGRPIGAPPADPSPPVEDPALPELERLLSAVAAERAARRPRRTD